MDTRQQSILRAVIDKGRMGVTDLTRMTSISEVTIRQDLNLPEKQSCLRRTHGYAVPLDSENVETHMMTHFAIKCELASRTATLVSVGKAIFIENGSSNALLARTLAEHGDITIITVSSYIAYLLKETLEGVILLGGVYQRRNESMVGPLTRQFIQRVYFSKTFIGIGGWQAETDFTGRDMIRVGVINAVLEKYCGAIILSDSSKFSAVHLYPLGPARRFNRVITDDCLSAACRDQLLHSDLTIDIVPYVRSLPAPSHTNAPFGAILRSEGIPSRQLRFFT